MMESEKFTVLQLKEVLRQLGLSLKGNKQELLKRLFEYDPAGTWQLMAKNIPAEGNLAAGTSTEMDGIATQQQSKENLEARTEEETLREKELEIMRRERDLMRRELEILRQERGDAENTRLIASSSTNVSQGTTTRSQLQPKALSELLSEFSGSGDTFPVWRRQFDLIRATY